MVEPSRSAALVRDFANTVDVEEGTDTLGSPAQLAGWLVAAGLLDRAPRASAADLASCLTLRAGIREALGADGDPAPHRLAAADAVLAGLPVLVSMSSVTEPARQVLVPAPSLAPVQRALGTLAIAWTELVATGESSRLKRCPEESCGWVFWDVSKNHSRRWCSMRVCGNRTKARKFAARQRDRDDTDA